MSQEQWHHEYNRSVTLPLNVSLDLGSMCGTQHDLATIDTDPCWSRAKMGHKVRRHLDVRCSEYGRGHEWRKGVEPLCLARDRRWVAIQEDQAGVLVFDDYILNTTMKRALKHLLNLKPTTAILGSSHSIVHVILSLTDGKSVTNYRLLE